VDIMEIWWSCVGVNTPRSKKISLDAAGTFCVTRGAQAVCYGIVATVAVSMPLVDAPWV
jgi:hypothetical protein